MADLMSRAIALGGNSWTNPRTGEQRVYLDPQVWGKMVGLDFTTYRSGNISGATFQGSDVSNAKALDTVARKVWVDARGVHVEDGGRKSVVSTQDIKDALTSALTPAPGSASARQARMAGS